MTRESVGALGRAVLVLISFFLLAVTAPGQGSASIDYEVGWIEGSVETSGGEPLQGIRVSARTGGGGGSVWSYTDALGSYRLELPAGEYEVLAAYDHHTIGAATITVEAGQTVDDERTAFVLHGAPVQLQVERDGEPDAFCSVEFVAWVPSCADADECAWLEDDSCACSFDGRPYHCHGTECWWDDAEQESFFASGDGDGRIEKLLPVGNYTVRARSGWFPEQSSLLTVAELEVEVVDGEPIDLGTVPYETGVLTGIVTVDGSPRVGVRVSARAVWPGLPSGWAQTWSAEGGEYALRLPLGLYDVHATVDWVDGERTQVEIGSSGATLDLEFSSGAKTVRGSVVVDGEPGAHALIALEEQQPSSCEVADSCEWIEGDGSSCDGCWLAEREFSCWSGQCWWWDEGEWRSTWTEHDGAWELEVPAGNYALHVYSAHQPGQSGHVLVEGDIPVVVDEASVVDVGVIAYSTGILHGTVTRCGDPDSSWETRIQARSRGSISTTPDASGDYSMRLPVGEYTTELQWRWAVVEVGSAEVTTEAEASFSADRTTGELTGKVLRDGVGAHGAAVSLTEAPPSSCAIADECGWLEPGDPESCWDCRAGTRWFDCWNGECWWWDEGSWVEVYTGVEGDFLAEVTPGDYVANVYSAPVPGQSGRVWVGSVEARVSACMMSEIGASGTQVPTGTEVVAELSDGVVLTFDDVTGSGSVSYVATSTPQGGDPPAETIEFLGLFYDFTVTAEFTGMVQVCLPYDPETIPGPPESLSIYHYEDGEWHELESTPDEENERVCALTSSFSWYVAGFRHGQPPVADAGDPIDAVAGPGCMARVLLDGSRSHQPGVPDATLVFTWRLGDDVLGTGAQLEADLPLGVHVVELEVEADGHSHRDTVRVEVVDRTPPHLAVSVSPDRLWPPNGRLVDITSNVVVEDACDPAPTVELAGVESAAAGPNDVVITEDGVSLRAHRKGNERLGRSYLLRWVARDAAGNAAEATATVVVPHDQRP
jgi:hypothetical protein